VTAPDTLNIENVFTGKRTRVAHAMIYPTPEPFPSTVITGPSMRKPFPACAVCLLGAALLTLALEPRNGSAQRGVEDRIVVQTWPWARPCHVFSSHEEQDGRRRNLPMERPPTRLEQQGLRSLCGSLALSEFVVVDLETNCALHRVLLHPRGDRDERGQGISGDFTIQVCREGDLGRRRWRSATTPLRGMARPSHSM